MHDDQPRTQPFARGTWLDQKGFEVATTVFNYSGVGGSVRSENRTLGRHR